jgi:hypothetical protein
VSDDWLRITRRPSGLTEPAPSVDPERERRDRERWDRAREREDEMRRTGVDPIVRELRRAGETGGNPSPCPTERSLAGRDDDGR